MNQDTRIFRTMTAICAVLDNGAVVPSGEFRIAVEAEGGVTDIIADAVKTLRNAGVMVYATKGQNAEWRILDQSKDGDKAEVWNNRQNLEALSEKASTACALGYATNPVIVQARNAAISDAMQIGVKMLGMEPSAIMAMCTPKPIAGITV